MRGGGRQVSRWQEEWGGRGSDQERGGGGRGRGGEIDQNEEQSRGRPWWNRPSQVQELQRGRQQCVKRCETTGYKQAKIQLCSTLDLLQSLICDNYWL